VPFVAPDVSLAPLTATLMDKSLYLVFVGLQHMVLL
jgi:hypothetical protein